MVELTTKNFKDKQEEEDVRIEGEVKHVDQKGVININKKIFLCQTS